VVSFSLWRGGIVISVPPLFFILWLYLFGGTMSVNFGGIFFWAGLCVLSYQWHGFFGLGWTLVACGFFDAILARAK